MYKLNFAAILLLFLLVIPVPGEETAAEMNRPPVSEETRECLECHRSLHPGIVHDWETSLHSRMTPAAALKKEPRQRRVSATTIPESRTGVVVGCYECHGLNPERHADNFEHMGQQINIVVSPDDCAVCHSEEASQYAGSKKAHAVGNLMNNPVYHALVSSATGVMSWSKGTLSSEKPTDSTLGETCLGCHGTKVEVTGTREVETEIGAMVLPVLSNWPNQGVGRLNPDGSKGSCSSCHPRHTFSIAVARKPETCGQCHLEPDVPAYNVYKASKHGNLYSAMKEKWDFEAVPWKLGKDFQAPTCAACHNSLITGPDGTEVIAERTHDFGARLWVRLFGLIYSHPQPISGDTSILKNGDGLPLPVTFAGKEAASGLIGPEEQEKRRTVMSRVCESCHSSQWTAGHFRRLDQTITETNAMTLTSTQIMQEAWDKKLEDPTNPFDETMEKIWQRQWLFYANSIRYASAMTGAYDYAAFKNGWWELSANMEMLKDWLKLKEGLRK